MLPPEVWKELRAEIRATRSEIARLTASGESPEAEEYQREKLERITRTLAEHNDGSDPWAPLGGLDVRFGPFFLLGAVTAFLSSQRRRERWLYFSLASNAALCLGVAMVMTIFVPRSAHELRDDVGYLELGGIALGIAAAVVLRIERRARCRLYASERARAVTSTGAVNGAAPPVAMPEPITASEVPPVTSQPLPPAATPPQPISQPLSSGR
jgi:hypothetical protein